MAISIRIPPTPSVPLLDAAGKVTLPWLGFFNGLLNAINAILIVSDSSSAAAKTRLPDSTDLTDTIVPASYIPTDLSGAGLTFSNVSVQSAKYGNWVYMYGTLTYPATADGSVARISLPIAVPNQPYAAIPGTLLLTGTTGWVIIPVVNTSQATFAGAAGALTNADLSAKNLVFILTYPAS